ncbi:MAG: PAS domain-containing sensor histidine kinase [Cyclobacteriaceae bacterium]
MSKTRNHMNVSEYLEIASDLANVGLWDWDVTQESLYMTRECKRMLGYKETDKLNIKNQLHLLVHPYDLEKVNSMVKGGLLGLFDKQEIELRLFDNKGSFKWYQVKATITTDEFGKVIRVTGSLSDITERKETEDSLIESEERYRNLFENSLIGIIRVDLKSGKVIEANNKGWTILDGSPGEDFYMFDRFFTSDDKKNFIKLLTLNGCIEKQEVKIVKQKKEIWYLINGNFIADEGILDLSLLDITENQNSINELKRLNSELDKFVYHSSHDLRSPLKSLLGLINILRKEEDPKGRENCMVMMEKSIHRLEKLVNDLLMLSRNNRIENTYEEIDLTNEIKESLADFSHMKGYEGLEISQNISQPVPFVTDVTRLKIVLNNMLSNAIKYRSYHRDKPFLKISAKVDKDQALIDIEDNGIGIKKSKQDKIFEMFYRASESSEGSGLGLYIVKNVIEKMKGSISMESEEQIGTRFSIKLPNHLNGYSKVF